MQKAYRKFLETYGIYKIIERIRRVQTMIQPRMTELNENEILLYLGYRGQELDEELLRQITVCQQRIADAARPGLVYRRLPVENGQIKGFPLEGDDIRALLSPCREAILMAATLGSEVERILMRAEVTDMADALIMDSCASTAIENVCDHFEMDLREELKTEGLYLTDRFSPGYGDLPISCQGQLCNILQTNRRIGLTVTPSNIMVPRKSVTAIMGISAAEQPLRKRGCEVCSMFKTCTYRKGGTSCHE